MIQCSCGKEMDKVPNWLGSVNVQFVCTNCPNRHVKGITQVTFEPIRELKEEVQAMTAELDSDDDSDTEAGTEP